MVNTFYTTMFNKEEQFFLQEEFDSANDGEIPETVKDLREYVANNRSWFDNVISDHQNICQSIKTKLNL